MDSMAAPEGNQFWKLRSKHGRDRIIQDPETLSKAADEYFQWCEENPILQKDFRGKDADTVYLEHPRVFTKEGLARYLDVNEWRVISQLKDVSEDFNRVVTRIEKTIYEQKFTYASVNMFNSNIIARDLGLADKREIEKKKVTFRDAE